MASPSSTPPPAGIYVPVPTFFVPATSPEYNPLTPPLDLDAQASHALHLARSGITGLVLLGSTGEAVHLTRTERVAQIKHVRAALTAGGYEDYPLIAGTATNGIEETVELLNESAAAGAGWGLVLAPGYFAAVTSEEGIIAWYKGVAEGSSIPVMIYHYPGVSNNIKLPPSIFRTLAAHPNIVGGKLSHGDISIHAQIALDPEIDHSKFHLFTGLGQQLFPALQVGCSGAIDGLAAIFPKTVVHLYNLVTRTEGMDQETLDRVRELQYRVSCAEELIVKFGTVGIKEAVAHVLSFGEPDGGRLPLARGMGYGEWERWSVEMTEMARVEMELQAS
ncbi:aldolase [Choiromyces venosus 120613-1]|uniref:Aldolase n=1 Tax=Choiromyces venosus 120613-1 TaxID=1336337 RepID=A0A3N4IZF0_9PEZI|nr:aldolase [Choiromyces venosus 120613-1]